MKELRNSKAKLIYIDKHVPNLIAVPVNAGSANSAAYREGKLIFQDKASCFPAYLLDHRDGDVIDGCAAPGNKTTHVAAIMHERSGGEVGTVFACEKDALRSKTLEKMTKLADPHHDIIHVKAEQNFLKLDPGGKEFVGVTSLLLDPSCSGSGIVSRDEGGIVVHLPSLTPDEPAGKKGKKRKRGSGVPVSLPALVDAPSPDLAEEEAEADDQTTTDLQTRLIALADFQLRLLKHAMRFPAAQRITYSTCSINAEENEMVVLRAIACPVVQDAGWRVMRRDEQVSGMKRWHRRGDLEAAKTGISALEVQEQESLDVRGVSDLNAAEIAEACIRCDKTGEEGTMGFFVAGFVRGEPLIGSGATRDEVLAVDHQVHQSECEDEEWNGFESD